jgi:tRNA1(Val) A37 N6-methylase TrmN6
MADCGAAEGNAGAVTEDMLLGGRLRLRQPAHGARVAIDPIFLAAAVPAAPGQRALDIGCGVGPATLCLAAREPECRVVGLEIAAELAQLARDNAAWNAMGHRIAIVTGDLLRPPPALGVGTFDHVMANPPFLARGHGTLSPDAAKARARFEDEAELADWIDFAVAMVRDRGTVTFIHRADRIDVLLGGLARCSRRVGEIAVFPLWPAPGRPAKRIIVQARRRVAAPARLLPGLILHAADGRFTAAADAVLRGGERLPL